MKVLEEYSVDDQIRTFEETGFIRADVIERIRKYIQLQCENYNDLNGSIVYKTPISITDVKIDGNNLIVEFKTSDDKYFRRTFRGELWRIFFGLDYAIIRDHGWIGVLVRCPSCGKFGRLHKSNNERFSIYHKEGDREYTHSFGPTTMFYDELKRIHDRVLELRGCWRD